MSIRYVVFYENDGGQMTYKTYEKWPVDIPRFWLTVGKQQGRIIELPRETKPPTESDHPPGA